MCMRCMGQVVDMRFSSSSNLLASCDTEGEVFVRRILEDTSDGGAQSASDPIQVRAPGRCWGGVP